MIYKRIRKNGEVAQSLKVNENEKTMIYYGHDYICDEYQTSYSYQVIKYDFGKDNMLSSVGVMDHTIELKTPHDMKALIDHFHDMGYKLKMDYDKNRIYKKKDIKEYKEELKKEEKRHKFTYLLIDREVKGKCEAFVAKVRDDDNVYDYLKTLKGVKTANFYPMKKAYDLMNELNNMYKDNNSYMYDM